MNQVAEKPEIEPQVLDEGFKPETSGRENEIGQQADAVGHFLSREVRKRLKEVVGDGEAFSELAHPQVQVGQPGATLPAVDTSMERSSERSSSNSEVSSVELESNPDTWEPLQAIATSNSSRVNSSSSSAKSGLLASCSPVSILFNGSMFCCKGCDYKSAKESHVARHLKGVHLKVREHQCHLCGKLYSDKKGLASHLLRHTDDQGSAESGAGAGKRKVASESEASADKRYRCSLCQFESWFQESVQRHLRVVHLNLKKFSCQGCHKRFAERRSHLRHTSICPAAAVAKKSYPASGLEGQPLSQEGHKAIQEVHTQFNGARVLELDPDKHNLFERQFKKCVQLHSENQMFFCFLCNFSSADLDLARSHFRSQHFKSGLLTNPSRGGHCPYCSLKLAARLDRHIKLVHLKRKDFKCAACSKSFSRRSHLQGHSCQVKPQPQISNNLNEPEIGNLQFNLIKGPQGDISKSSNLSQSKMKDIAASNYPSQSTVTEKTLHQPCNDLEQSHSDFIPNNDLDQSNHLLRTDNLGQSSDFVMSNDGLDDNLEQSSDFILSIDLETINYEGLIDYLAQFSDLVSSSDHLLSNNFDRSDHPNDTLEQRSHPDQSSELGLNSEPPEMSTVLIGTNRQ